MKPLYTFWRDGYSNCTTQENPLSSINGTLTSAFEWARMLLKLNTYATYVEFKRQHSRKIYRVERQA